LAWFAPHCETRDGVEVASSELACLLVVAVASAAGQEWSSPDCQGTSGAHPTDDRRKSAFGSKADPSGTRETGVAVSARTVAKYMNSRHSRGPSSGWRKFFERHESSPWACDFFCVQKIWFQTLYVFFVIRHVNREILHVGVTPFPTAEWIAQQIVEASGLSITKAADGNFAPCKPS
jgi:hypothetical protein